MVIYYQENNTLHDVLSGVSSFAGGYAQGKATNEQLRMQRERLEAMKEAERGQQAILEEERTYRRSERDRQNKQRQADAELRGLLLDEARGSTRPTAEKSPEMGALGVVTGALAKAFGGKTDVGDPDAQMAQEENRKWDAFQRVSPNLSPDGQRMLFAKLQQDTQEKAQKAQYGALARRMGQLSMPAKSPAGSEMPGLDPEDPEQGQLIAQIQGMIDQRADPEQINDTIAELEGELKRDRLHQIKREGRLGKMQEALTAFPSFASQEEIDAAHEVFLDLQNDQTRDPDDAWNEFRSTLFGGRDRWTTAYEMAAKRTMASRDEIGNPAPRLPSESEVFEAGKVMFPHDPRFRTDVETYPRSPMEQEGGANGSTGNGAAQPGPQFSQPQSFQDGPIGYSADVGVQRASGERPATNGGAAPAPSPEAEQAVRTNLTTDVLNAMAGAVDQAKTPEDADRAIAAAAKKAGLPLDALPEWLLKTLAQRYQAVQGANQQDRVGAQQAQERRGRATGASTEKPGPADRPKPGQLYSEPEAFKDGPIGYSDKFEDSGVLSFEEPKAFKDGPIGYSDSLGAQMDSAARDERIAKRVRSGPLGGLAAPSLPKQGAPPPLPEGSKKSAKPIKRWKRMSSEEQKAAEKALLEQASKSTRYDFHGALAPKLRELGIDLGSIPKDVALRLRNVLKKHRQQGRLHSREVGG